MPQLLPYSDELCAEELEGASTQLRQKLKESGVSAAECKKWLTSVHQYPPQPEPPEVFTLHVFRPNWFKYGAHPFTKVLSFEHETFSEQLSEELARLCLELGPVMDKTLQSVLSDVH